MNKRKGFVAKFNRKMKWIYGSIIVSFLAFIIGVMCVIKREISNNAFLIVVGISVLVAGGLLALVFQVYSIKKFLKRTERINERKIDLNSIEEQLVKATNLGGVMLSDKYLVALANRCAVEISKINGASFRTKSLFLPTGAGFYYQKSQIVTLFLTSRKLQILMSESSYVALIKVLERRGSMKQPQAIVDALRDI